MSIEARCSVPRNLKSLGYVNCKQRDARLFPVTSLMLAYDRYTALEARAKIMNNQWDIFFNNGVSELPHRGVCRWWYQNGSFNKLCGSVTLIIASSFVNLLS